MSNLKTTLAGVAQLLMLAVFAYTKVSHGVEFSEAEMTLMGTLLISGYKGIVGADAKK